MTKGGVDPPLNRASTTSAVRGRPGYALLRRVTHWSPAMMARSEGLREADIRPTHVLTGGFAELMAQIDFRRFTPRSFPA